MTKPKNKAQKAYNAESKKNEKLLDKAKETPSQRTARLSKLAEDITARGGRMEGGNLVMPLGLGPAKQVLNGLDGQQLRATTPPAVQEAADEYFDRKSDVETAKDRMATALDKIESEMKASDITVCVVQQRVGGESMVCRIKSSSKLEIKKQK